MKTTIIITIIFLLIISLFVRAIFKDAKQKKEGRDELGDDVDQQVPQLVEYNKSKAYIPKEDMAVWEDLPREQKRQALKTQEKMVKKGQLIPVIDPVSLQERLITRKEAIEKNVIK